MSTEKLSTATQTTGKNYPNVTPAAGKLAVMIPGLGAVATTFIAGVEAVKKGLGIPIGSVSQLQTIRLGKRDENRNPLIKDFISLASLEDIVFGGWDLHGEDAYTVATRSQVLEANLLSQIKDELSAIKSMTAVFSIDYVKRLHGTNVKTGDTKWDLAQQVRDDIRNFLAKNKCTRGVMVWCGSTEVYLEQNPEVHGTLAGFEKGLKENHPSISPSMIYAYAALSEGLPFANGAPNLTVDIPAINQLARQNRLPICGKDFKTGQTLMKTIIAPGLKARMLGLSGWYSTNILGNRDGEVLDDPASFKTKEVSKLSVLDGILRPDQYPQLYGDIYHKVCINYYPPRGDAKEGWDNIDIVGWLGYPMQIKVNFLCRDSILAAPIVLDLAIFMDLAHRAGMSGIQEWLSFFFKSPMAAEGLRPEHDLFIQHRKFKNTLRFLGGEELITHLGMDYYEDR